MASSPQASERPLESPALGSSLSSLIAPCHDSLRPASPPPATRTPIGATFSGGGFRATFAALGVVRYLADAGVLGDLRYSSSVSGGSVANGLLATRWPALRARQFSPAAVDELVIGPLVEHVVASSLKTKLIRNVWRAALRKNRTDVLAWAFDDWLFDKAELESLDAECRWIFNALEPRHRDAVRVRTRCRRRLRRRPRPDGADRGSASPRPSRHRPPSRAHSRR